jgi:uncharacterized protein DUF4397
MSGRHASLTRRMLNGKKARILPGQGTRQPWLPALAVIALAPLALALGLSACENVAGYTQPSLVRVIDASYIAPAVNVEVEGTLLAANIGQGTITPYGTLPASSDAVIDVTAATGGATLVGTNGALLAGHQHSVFLTDNGAAPTSYEVTVLEDQQVAAAGGHSAFRFLNQAPKTGAIDVYMIPSGTTMADTIPLVSDLAVGATAGYVSFTSQTVTMVITPTGVITPKYTSTALALTGGEVRTVLIVDTQLTSNPPVEVFTANDVN